MPKDKRWDVATAELPSPRLLEMLKDGWEPFASTSLLLPMPSVVTIPGGGVQAKAGMRVVTVITLRRVRVEVPG